MWRHVHLLEAARIGFSGVETMRHSHAADILPKRRRPYQRRIDKRVHKIVPRKLATILTFYEDRRNRLGY